MVKKPAVVMFLHVRVEGGPGLEGRFSIFLGSEDHVLQKGEGDGSGEERVRENSDIRIIVLALVIVQASQEEISFIIFTQFVNEFVIVFSQTRNIVSHTAVDFVRLAVTLEIGMISEDKDFMFGSHEEMAPVFKTMNNCQ